MKIGFSLERPPKAAKGTQERVGEVATEIESAIESGAGMSLGKDETIPLIPTRGIGTHSHLLKIKCGQDIGCRQTTPGMPGPRSIDKADGDSPDLRSYFNWMGDIDTD
jgi:hypothetical protein